MDQIDLLKSENRIHREENETFIRRRNAKKSRVRQGDIMALGEGQELQAQNVVDVQVKQEMQQSSGRKPRTETKLQQCGVCGKPRHTARTCPITVEMSEEDKFD